MRYATVCSGIEAPSVAWKSLGWEPVFFSEVAKFPSAVLKHRFPSVPNLGDMTKIGDKWKSYGPIDLIFGGTPCQDFSFAGRRKGVGGSRGALTVEFLRLAYRIRPRWIVMENVPGLRSSDEGQTFARVVRYLGKLGYGVAWASLDAKYFGLAQRRERVFIVGYFGAWQPAAAVLFDAESLRGNPSTRIPPWQATAENPNDSTAGGSRQGSNEKGNLIPSEDLAFALTTRCGAGRLEASETYVTETQIAHTLRGTGFDASEDGTGRGTPIVPVPFDTTQITSANNRSNPKPGDPCPTLAKSGHAPAIAFDMRNASAADICGTIGADQPKGNKGHGVIESLSVRRLTPRECERLQGFPDDFTLIPVGKGLAKDSPRYEALGNSIAVPCLKWIGERLDLIDRALAGKP